MAVTPEMPAPSRMFMRFWYVGRHIFNFYIILRETPRQKYIIPTLPVETQCGYNTHQFFEQKVKTFAAENMI
jgi:hypothetical protein